MEIEFEDKRLFTSPLRFRENHLNEAKEWNMLLNDVIVALRSGRRNEALASIITTRKDHLVSQLEDLAEYGYTTTLRRRALYLTEQITGVSSAEVVAAIESRMLEITT